ncbi:forkhead box protein J3-like isoform X2 [Oopsacas minuta]|uniref:Forkhead box protein J3-like isoform X2 n=1 Tax=Oopsacas minuta TaxID=111878 RepID=A0AAV7JWJ3_9METZ|nr:forkhead box protein J3-like isoform X2 [Oopsacas minuta]
MTELDRSLTNIDWLISCSKDKQPINSKIEQKHFCGNCLYCSRLGTRPKPQKISPGQSDTSMKSSSPRAPNKPSHSYAHIIATAIKKSSNQKLTLNEIYSSILDTYPYFRNAAPGWKNSVRHNLSLNKLFKRVARPKGESGKGAYWEIDQSAVLLVKREPKSLRKINSSKVNTSPIIPVPYPPVPYPMCHMYPFETQNHLNQSFTAFYRSLIEVQRLDDVTTDTSTLVRGQGELLDVDVSRFEGLVSSINPADAVSGDLFRSLKDSFSNFLRGLSNGPEVETYPKQYPQEELYSSNEPSSQEFDWNAIL